jgi:hypothetical protein
VSGAYLLDVNVLLGLFWPDNPDHPASLQWFRENHKKGWATCPATQAAFIRLSSNRIFMSNALNPAAAISLLEKNVRHPNHQFWTEHFDLPDLLAPFAERIQGYRQISDAYLLGLTMKNRGRLVTFDKAISTLLPPNTRKSEWIVELSAPIR